MVFIVIKNKSWVFWSEFGDRFIYRRMSMAEKLSCKTWHIKLWWAVIFNILSDGIMRSKFIDFVTVVTSWKMQKKEREVLRSSLPYICADLRSSMHSALQFFLISCGWMLLGRPLNDNFEQVYRIGGILELAAINFEIFDNFVLHFKGVSGNFHSLPENLTLKFALQLSAIS